MTETLTPVIWLISPEKREPRSLTPGVRETADHRPAWLARPDILVRIADQTGNGC